MTAEDPGLHRPSATLAAMSGGDVRRGAFITVDGPDGGGKTTQAEWLALHLQERGMPVRLTREPGGTWLGERIRELLLERTGSTAPTDPLADAMLFDAARRQLVQEVIRPALDDGETVICARPASTGTSSRMVRSGRTPSVARSLSRRSMSVSRPAP